MHNNLPALLNNSSQRIATQSHSIGFLKIISLENLYLSYKEFRRGKRHKLDVQLFERHLEDNLFLIHNQLKNKTYKHSSYTSFYINDPKRRYIHKASVRDRIVHHAIYRILYLIFDKFFIYDSYSCRLNKGTHKAVDRLEKFTRIISQNYTQPLLVLKCDIKKFFASVDHQILLDLIKKKIKNKDVLWLIEEIIQSFDSRERESKHGKIGLPIGNLTSQLFANIYLNELDQFIRHILKIKYHLRYCDDFVILDNDREKLDKTISQIADFLQSNLKLFLHPNKIIIRKLRQGIEFLGYVVLPHHRVLRTKTKKRILNKINADNLDSYLGLLKHANAYRLSLILKKRTTQYSNQLLSLLKSRACP